MTFRSQCEPLICPGCGEPVPDTSVWFIPQTNKFACSERCARKARGLTI